MELLPTQDETEAAVENEKIEINVEYVHTHVKLLQRIVSDGPNAVRASSQEDYERLAFALQAVKDVICERVNTRGRACEGDVIFLPPHVTQGYKTNSWFGFLCRTCCYWHKFDSKKGQEVWKRCARHLLRYDGLKSKNSPEAACRGAADKLVADFLMSYYRHLVPHMYRRPFHRDGRGPGAMGVNVELYDVDEQLSLRNWIWSPRFFEVPDEANTFAQNICIERNIPDKYVTMFLRHI